MNSRRVAKWRVAARAGDRRGRWRRPRRSPTGPSSAEPSQFSMAMCRPHPARPSAGSTTWFPTPSMPSLNPGIVFGLLERVEDRDGELGALNTAEVRESLEKSGFEELRRRSSVAPGIWTTQQSAPGPSASRASSIWPGTSSRRNGAARCRRSRTDRRSQYCRSMADRWTRAWRPIGTSRTCVPLLDDSAHRG